MSLIELVIIVLLALGLLDKSKVSKAIKFIKLSPVIVSASANVITSFIKSINSFEKSSTLKCFFDLQKERLAAKTADASYFDYVVQPGDNLWNIAGRQYGDAKSWIILLQDNEESIKASAGILSPGMVLKLRDKLDPNS